MVRFLKFLLLTLPICAVVTFLTGFLLAFAGSMIIPLFSPIGGSFSLGYAGDMIWLFGIGGFFGLLIGLLVSLKIWKRVK